MLALSSLGAQAQNRTISGRVAGSDGGPLPGVTVVVKGGTQGTSTDAEGRYTLSVPSTASKLVFSFIGYESQEIAIGDQSSINATLKAGTTGLDEVVVVGYGTQSRRDLTGSVATVSAAQIANRPVQSFEQALQGQAPGVNVTTPNGLLNNPPVIRVRGVNSISLSSQPLFVIDGIPAFSGNNSAVGAVPNNPLSNVNPQDIESVEVLKDASAAAIYGSRAAGGVVLVTTKKGKRGQSRLSVDSWAGWTRPVRLIDVLNAEQYMEIKNEGVRNLNANRPGATPAVEGFRPFLDANGNAVDTRWYDYVYRTGFSTSNTINFSGGTEKTTYYASVGYTDQKGMLRKNEFKRASARLNLDQRLFKTFSIGMRVGYANNRNLSPNSGSVGDGAFGTGGLGRLPLVLPPNVSPYNNDGTLSINAAGIGSGANINPLTGNPLPINFYNPIVDLENNYFQSESNEIQGSVYANWEIVKGLTANTTFGINNIAFEDRSFQTPLAGDGQSLGGSAFNFYRTNRRWNWQNTLQYDRTFGEAHGFSLLVGGEQQLTATERWGAQRTGVADPYFDLFQGGFANIAPSGNFQGENYLVSYFSRLNYDFKKKYLLTATARRDGYSAFAEKWGNFFGASAGYVLSEEDFWKNSSALAPISFLKFTGSFGEVGNNQGISDFGFLDTYNSGFYGAPPAVFFNNSGNPNLTWETSRKTDAGLSFGLLDNRISGDFTYYRNFVDNLILRVPQSLSRGIPGGGLPGDFLDTNTFLANVGSMRNTGIELNLRADAIRTPSFTWTVSGNLTTLKNRVLELATEGQRIGTATSNLETANFTEVGRSVGEILAVPTTGINPDNGRRIFRKADGTLVQYDHLGTGWTRVDNGAPTTTPSQLTDGQYYGPVLPKWFGGIDNTFRYRNFDLGVFIQYSGGNYIYNGTRAGLHDQRFWNNATSIMDRWTETNRNAEWPRVVYTDNISNGSALVISSNVEKGDFARLRNVVLGYTFNTELLGKLRMSSLRVYGQVQNAALLTRYKGIDPEISSNGANNTGAGVDRNSIGQARVFTAGLNLGF